jgi:murein DD-endopeptidase MepM/ murein hydrolase activator NlpD
VRSVLPGTRRAIGFGLLVQSLLLIGPSSVSAETKAPVPRSSQKRVPPHGTKTGGLTSDRSGRCEHIVRRGDSLARVAALYRTTRRALIAANVLTTSEKLRVGQRLQISGCPLAPRHRPDEPDPTLADENVTQLLARVGPRRVLTRLFLAVPDFDREAVAFKWPVDGPIASSFGRRHKGWHAGVDIQAEMGTPIRAAAEGTVIVSGWERYYGRMIKIEHGGGFTSLYAHNLENLVEVGDVVGAGAVIGTVGRSGRASADHLHFEIRQEGVAYNPLHLLEPQGAPLLISTTTATLHDDEDRE